MHMLLDPIIPQALQAELVNAKAFSLEPAVHRCLTWSPPLYQVCLNASWQAGMWLVLVNPLTWCDLSIDILMLWHETLTRHQC